MRLHNCRHCSKPIKRPKHGGYCSDMCSYKAWKETAEPCTYCGMPANTIDHVPPISARPILTSMGVSRWDFLEVPSCHECNSAIGAKALWTVRERKQWIKGFLSKKYKRILKMPNWTEEEISELGRGLKDHVEAFTALKKLTIGRVGW